MQLWRGLTPLLYPTPDSQAELKLGKSDDEYPVIHGTTADFFVRNLCVKLGCPLNIIHLLLIKEFGEDNLDMETESY